MSKQIKLTFNKKEYTLEFSRETIMAMERNGFTLDAMGSQLMAGPYDLFCGAFLMHHSNVKPKVIDDIYMNLKDRVGLINALVEMFKMPYTDLYDPEAEDGKEGNLGWTANWE